MAKAYDNLGDLTPAAKSLEQAVSINPRVASYFYVLASVYRKLGKAEESRKAMESFTKLDRETNELEQKRRDWVNEERQAGSAHE
jgi:Tfp pilus assembly protein PilF